ncbi:Phosphoenolpyruvate-protein phosphotransferase of PTS system [hydrothermal vent metagenome]|uniref:Phosphoenolpyruvate-protein phosphotransferase n=1 Tax=hydrothermal vent metagenome TaxID=652676 RepID=A0A3B1AHW4_9ZZZZ
MTLACTGIGIGVTRSIAIGEVWCIECGHTKAHKRMITTDEVTDETARFQQAVAAASQELKGVRDQIPASTPTDISSFIDTHLLMLEDAALVDASIEAIQEHLFGAEWALQLRRDALIEVFDAMEDPYLRTRKDDVDHVVNLIQKHLQPAQDCATTNGEDLKGKIILAQDLTPADTILMRNQDIAAFITEYGSPLSHTAILARSLGIPAIVGAHKATQHLQHGELLIIDAEQGVILANPDERTLKHYQSRLNAELAHTASLNRLIDEPSVSIDGINISLMTNIELPEDIKATNDVKAAGVGLYRTEFLYMNRTAPPNEEEHLESYRKIIEGLDGIPITIRTLDLGADKEADGSCHTPKPASNPALGLRAIRLCLKEPELFRPQLRAILRASSFGSVRILIPMLSSLQELHTVQSIIEETKRDLKRQGLDFNPQIPVGGMIEVPAAALAADSFAKRLDFLSIGTNDLIQYTLAIDRVDDEVNYLYDPMHPSILRLIQHTIQAGHTAGIPVSMCGEMAGSQLYIPLLLGLGLREFSMRPGAVLEAKDIVRASDISQLSSRVCDLMARIDDEDATLLLSGLTCTTH